MKKTIIFSNRYEDYDINPPTPAIKSLPDWYKEIPSYSPSKWPPFKRGGNTGATVKKCIPVLDAMSSGYIISTHCDIWVSRENNVPIFYWKTDLQVIEHQGLGQAKNHPDAGHTDVPKFINPWSIRTPKGYSCLFIPPTHRETPFKALPGIVDTDSYTVPINFPFVFSDPWFEGLIPQGTPVVQVIPFKRDAWASHVESTDESRRDMKSQSTFLSSVFYNGYKNKFWSKKDYK